MMKSVEKMSKKERKAYFAQFRGSWNGVNPVTKTIPNKCNAAKVKEFEKAARNG